VSFAISVSVKLLRSMLAVPLAMVQYLVQLAVQERVLFVIKRTSEQMTVDEVPWYDLPALLSGSCE
jgi:hypothetical protein